MPNGQRMQYVRLATENFERADDALAKKAAEERRSALVAASANPDDSLESGNHYIYSGFRITHPMEGCYTLTYDIRLTKAATAAQEAHQADIDGIFN